MLIFVDIVVAAAYSIALHFHTVFCFPKLMEKNLRINHEEYNYSSTDVWSEKKFARIVSEETKKRKK